MAVSYNVCSGGQQGSKFFVVRKHEDAEHKLPKRGDRSINWQETYFLNIITNHLKYCHPIPSLYVLFLFR
jgi:hypothetical protein